MGDWFHQLLLYQFLSPIPVPPPFAIPISVLKPLRQHLHFHINQIAPFNTSKCRLTTVHHLLNSSYTIHNQPAQIQILKKRKRKKKLFIFLIRKHPLPSCRKPWLKLHQKLKSRTFRQHTIDPIPDSRTSPFQRRRTNVGWTRPTWLDQHKKLCKPIQSSRLSRILIVVDYLEFYS